MCRLHRPSILSTHCIPYEEGGVLGWLELAKAAMPDPTRAERECCPKQRMALCEGPYVCDSCLCKGSSSCPTVNEVRTKPEQTWSMVSFLAALVDCPCERMEQKCLGIVDILPGQQICHVNMVANYDWRDMPLVETHAGIRRV